MGHPLLPEETEILNYRRFLAGKIRAPPRQKKPEWGPLLPEETEILNYRRFLASKIKAPPRQKKPEWGTRSFEECRNYTATFIGVFWSARKRSRAAMRPM